MDVSPPTYLKEGSRFIRVPDNATSAKPANLLDKHQSTIARLHAKLGFQKDGDRDHVVVGVD